jgi:hypothetical protein
MQHGPITDAVPGPGLGCVEDGLHLLGVQEADQLGVCLLEGDGKDSTDLL